ncbi:unnamed protein product [Cladocopium goreaui]|uniref:Uncharacterized protein n=1 Tax=Cladocopium goreaui TaxID=2562237 RepID=A0A9P1CE29_9DINO|nr:unnamed protein product [Cladocopium goreaui]
MPKQGSSGFEARLEELREEFPGCIDLAVPKEARDWSDADLRNFFESGGFIKPLKKEAPEASPPPSAGLVQGPQFSVPEALQLQEKLLAGFKHMDFHQKLKRLQLQYPQRKQKGHPDGSSYFEAFEVLVMTVFCGILPTHGLRGDWDGVGDMFAQMASALKNPKVKKQHEEINTLLGLPRDARLAASRREDLIVYCPGGDGTVLVPGSRGVIEDEDGDVAHEFLVEDEATGELRASFATNTWFRALQTVAIRSSPSIKSISVGACTKGQRLSVQRILNDRWLQLHESELQALGVPEAPASGGGYLPKKLRGRSLREGDRRDLGKYQCVLPLVLFRVFTAKKSRCLLILLSVSAPSSLRQFGL